MDVALAADRRSVPEAGGYSRKRRAQISFRLSRAAEGLLLLEHQTCQQGAGPGSKILGRNVLAGDFPEIGVYVGRGDVLQIAFFIDILQQLLSGQVLTALDDLGDSAVSHT